MNRTFLELVMSRILLPLISLSFVAAQALAQTPAAPPPPPRFEGSLVHMTGSAEIEVPNDEAFANFFVELQDPDLARAQSLVNQRVSEGVAALKKSDPKATIETGSYWTYPVYARDSRTIVAWRVRQSVTLRTADLETVARTVAAAQQQLALGGIDFRLTRAAREKVEGELIQRALANLNARVAAAAQALGVPAARVRIEELNFGGTAERPPIVAYARAAPQLAEAKVAEPTFDPGKSSQQLTVSGKVRFLIP
jgi:predicted secreted protein